MKSVPIRSSTSPRSALSYAPPRHTRTIASVPEGEDDMLVDKLATSSVIVIRLIHSEYKETFLLTSLRVLVAFVSEESKAVS